MRGDSGLGLIIPRIKRKQHIHNGGTMKTSSWRKELSFFLLPLWHLVYPKSRLPTSMLKKCCNGQAKFNYISETYVHTRARDSMYLRTSLYLRGSRKTHHYLFIYAVKQQHISAGKKKKKKIKGTAIRKGRQKRKQIRNRIIIAYLVDWLIDWLSKWHEGKKVK